MNKLMKSLLLAIIATIFCYSNGYSAELILNKHKLSRGRYSHELEMIWYNSDSTLVVKTVQNDYDRRMYNDNMELNFFSMGIEFLRIELEHFMKYEDKLDAYLVNFKYPGYKYGDYDIEVDCSSIEDIYDIQAKNDYILLVKDNFKIKLLDIKNHLKYIMDKLKKNKTITEEDNRHLDNLMLDIINYHNQYFKVIKRFW